MTDTKISQIGTSTNLVQDYVAGVEYNTTGTGTRKIEAIAHAEGRRYNVNVNTATTTPSFRMEYAIRDHLGNTRLTFTDKNNNGTIAVSSSPTTNEVLSETHYYPFGLSFGGNSWLNEAGDVDNRYRYNGKELQTEHGLNWYNYGARFYDPAVGRFTGVDPLAEKMPGWSPFNYTLGNPMIMIDPDGKAPNWIYDQQKDGSYKRREGAKNDGGANVHTYLNNNGTTMVHNVKAGTFVTVNQQEMGQKAAAYSAKIDAIKETVKQIGETTTDVGDGIAAAGYISTPITNGAAFPIAVAGEAISLIGKGVTNLVKIAENGFTTENKVDLGVDLGTELLPLPLENMVKKS